MAAQVIPISRLRAQRLTPSRRRAGMRPDDAAWASIADAAEKALMLPGLSSASSRELEELRRAALRCAGLPPAAIV